MADELVLAGRIRTAMGSSNARRLRREGQIPIVLYGHQEDAVHLSVPSEQVEAVLRHHSPVVDLSVDGAPEKALIKEIQHDAYGDRVLHLDLARIAMDETVQVQVAVELVGTPTGSGEGQRLEHLLHEVQIECLPGDIPESIRVRIGDLKVGDAVTIKDLNVPDGVTILADPDDMVVHLVEAQVVEEEIAVEGEEEPGAAEPEVIGAKPDEEEGEGEDSGS